MVFHQPIPVPQKQLAKQLELHASASTYAHVHLPACSRSISGPPWGPGLNGSTLAAGKLLQTGFDMPVSIPKPTAFKLETICLWAGRKITVAVAALDGSSIVPVWFRLGVRSSSGSSSHYVDRRLNISFHNVITIRISLVACSMAKVMSFAMYAICADSSVCFVLCGLSGS